MKTTYRIEGLQEKNTIGNIAVALHSIEGIQLVAFESEENQLTLEYKDSLADKIIEEVISLIKKMNPQAILKNLK